MFPNPGYVSAIENTTQLKSQNIKTISEIGTNKEPNFNIWPEICIQPKKQELFELNHTQPKSCLWET